MNWTTGIFILSYFFLCDAFDCNIEPRNAEGQIKKQILCNGYDKEESPSVQTKNDTIAEMSFYLSYYGIKNNDILTVDGDIIMEWMDDRLNWDPEKFHDIDTVALKTSDIWTPVLGSTENYAMNDINCADVHCYVESISKISCYIPCQFNVNCIGDRDTWPYDSYNCTKNIGTFSQRKEDTLFNKGSIVISQYLNKNSDFKLLGINAEEVNNETAGIENNLKSYMKYTFALERYGAHELSAIIPEISIFMVTNLCCLWLHPKVMERLAITIVTLILHLMITQNLRFQTGGFTNLQICLNNSFVLSAVTLFETILLRTFISSARKPPSWIYLFTKNRFGEMFIFRPYFIEVEAIKHQKEGSETSENLPQSSFGIILAKLIDRIYFLVVLIINIISLILYVPKRKIFGTFDSVWLTGYET